ncbi:MAG: DUF1552 domain-containing protein [Verrucomicrobia bacterium]|nr:DUF1552 domain-containing protein [Verrucomicrobiota bacterium]
MRRLNDGRSILDDVSEQAKSMRSTLGSEDRDKLDEYLTSVRESEQRMVNDESWAGIAQKVLTPVKKAD